MTSSVSLNMDATCYANSYSLDAAKFDRFAVADAERSAWLVREVQRFGHCFRCGAILRDEVGGYRGTCRKFRCRKAAAIRAGPEALRRFQAKQAAFSKDYQARKAAGLVLPPGRPKKEAR
ncbi:MAG: hypothetical protein ACLPJH_11215 [Myxococcaceae bacterium]